MTETKAAASSKGRGLVPWPFAMFGKIQLVLGIIAGFVYSVAAQTTPSLPDIRDAYGVALADLDGDGDLDLYLVGFRSLNRLLLNQGDGQFVDASIPSGAGGNLMPLGTRNLELGASAADFDNDGDVDLMVAGWGEGLALLRNRGDATFEDVTERLGIRRDMRANMALFSDMNGDSWLDLLLTDESAPMRLYRNDRGLRFIPVPLSETGLPSDSGSQAAVFTDLNLDGKPDLVVAGWHNPAQVFASVGAFRFQAISLEIDWPPGTQYNAALHGDLDQDGDIDLLFTARHSLPHVLLNQTNPPRQAVNPKDWKPAKKALALSPCDSNCGLLDTLDAYGGALFDADRDGDLDLYLTGRQPEKFYRNVGGRFMVSSPDSLRWPSTGSRYSTGFMVGNLVGPPKSHRNALDAVSAHRDTGSTLLIGAESPTASVRITLRGVHSNPQGLGSQVSLWRKATSAPAQDPWHLVGLRDLPGAQGYLSSYVGDLDFVLVDTADAEYRVRVAFSSGKVVTRRVAPGSGNIEVWESGFFGALGTRLSRITSIWLADPGHLKWVLAALAMMVGLFFLARLAVGAMARSIARREYTKTLEAKNQELEALLEQLHRTQGQLIQHEKLASLGQLVAGIAHELNNPIGFIYANLHQIARYMASLPAEALDERSRRNLAKAGEALHESQEGALRVRDIVQNLRGLARNGSDRSDAPPTKVACDLREQIDKALSVARTGFAPGITVEKRFTDIPVVFADPGQLQQVLLNLMVNAGQAMGEKGRLLLSVAANADEVTATVRDNGPGIAPEHRAKIFDPFFTTKPVGQGLGLGLHLAYTMVKANGGDLLVESPPPEGGHGAVFTLRFPVDETSKT